MNIFELMDSRVSSFSRTDRFIYESIKKFPDQFAHDSLTSLCDNGAFTKSAMTRFAQKLGFAGFQEFQYQFQQDISSYKNNEIKKSNADIYSRILHQVSDTVDKQQIRNIIMKMKQAKRLYILGSNLSRIPAETLLIALSFNSDICASLPSADMLPYRFNDDDMIIVYSAASGSNHQPLMRSLRREGQGKPYMVLITVNAKHPLRHNFTETVVLPTATMSDSASPVILSDTFAFLMFNDILTAVLQEKN